MESIIKKYLQLRHNNFSIMHGLIPFLQHFLTRTINQLIEGILTSESTFAFGVFANLTVV